jgi:hypothetical protein
MSKPMPSPRCPDCDVAMEEGFVVDYSHYIAFPQRWHRGKPKMRSALLGPAWDIVSARLMDVVTHRCPDCGLLRSFAHPKKWRKVD